MILDNACGASALVTSQLTHMLPVELMEEAQLIATDLSGKVVAEATRRIAELNWADHVFTFKMAQEVRCSRMFSEESAVTQSASVGAPL